MTLPGLQLATWNIGVMFLQTGKDTFRLQIISPASHLTQPQAPSSTIHWLM